MYNLHGAYWVAKQLGVPVVGSTTPMSFSGVFNGSPNQGLPSKIPRDYQAVYMVPQGGHMRTSLPGGAR